MAKVTEDIKVAADTTSKDLTASKESGEVQFVQNSDTFVLLHVPPGKPNRKDNGKTRVVQKQQKWGTCWYYALKVGAIIRPDYIERQKATDRKWVSAYRKAMTKLFMSLDYIEQELAFLHNNPAQNLIDSRKKHGIPPTKSVETATKEVEMLKKASTIFGADKKQAKEFFDEYVASRDSLFQKVSPTVRENFKAIFIPFMQEYFMSPCPHITAFRNAYFNIEQMNIQSAFIQQCGLDPEKACQQAGRDLFHQFVTAGLKESKEAMPFKHLAVHTSQMEPQVQFKLHKYAASKLVEKAYNLKPLAWHPETSTLDDFIKELKNGRAIRVGGFYGHAHYNKPPNPFKKPEIAPIYDVFGFPPGSHLKQEEILESEHAISVIGAEKKPGTTNEGWIYYIDPNIESAPNQKRKIFVMSYKQFCLQCTAEECWMNDGSKPKHFTYAFS